MEFKFEKGVETAKQKFCNGVLTQKFPILPAKSRRLCSVAGQGRHPGFPENSYDYSF
jgi:hypothetical protein